MIERAHAKSCPEEFVFNGYFLWMPVVASIRRRILGAPLETLTRIRQNLIDAEPAHPPKAYRHSIKRPHAGRPPSVNTRGQIQLQQPRERNDSDERSRLHYVSVEEWRGSRNLTVPR